MAHLVEKIAEKHVVARTNRVLLPGLVGAGLAASAVSAAVYDIGSWFGAW